MFGLTTHSYRFFYLLTKKSKYLSPRSLPTEFGLASLTLSTGLSQTQLQNHIAIHTIYQRVQASILNIQPYFSHDRIMYYTKKKNLHSPTGGICEVARYYRYVTSWLMTLATATLSYVTSFESRLI